MIRRTAWGGLARSDSASPSVALLGVPWDGGVGWRPGAAEAPSRLREISMSSPCVSEDGFVVDPESFAVVDLGDAGPGGALPDEAAREAYFARVQERAAEALALAPFALSIGGDHSVSIPLLRAFAGHSPEPMGVVLLDAHPDLFDEYDGSRLSHACPLRRALETGKLAPEHLLILGTRSYNPAELDLMRERGIRFVPARDLHRMGPDAAVELAAERLAGLERVYLTIDIDVADPACAPGTGAPVAGGPGSRELLDLVRGLMESLPVRAADLVEVSPPLDPTGATLFLALQLVFEIFAVRARSAR